MRMGDFIRSTNLSSSPACLNSFHCRQKLFFRRTRRVHRCHRSWQQRLQVCTQSRLSLVSNISSSCISYFKECYILSLNYLFHDNLFAVNDVDTCRQFLRGRCVETHTRDGVDALLGSCCNDVIDASGGAFEAE